MKYPRTARIFRGQLDAAPFAAVFFLLLMFLLLTSLVYTPGVRISLPAADRVAAPNMPTIVIAMDAAGHYFYENRKYEAAELRDQLSLRVRASPEPLALMVRADKAVTQETWLRLMLIARDAGIREAWLATLPRLFDEFGTNTTNGP